MIARLSPLALLLLAQPAIANGSIPVSEPGDAALFVLAVAGLILGRYASRPPRRDD